MFLLFLVAPEVPAKIPATTTTTTHVKTPDEVEDLPEHEAVEPDEIIQETVAATIAASTSQEAVAIGTVVCVRESTKPI